MAHVVDIQNLVYFKAIKETLLLRKNMSDEMAITCASKILDFSNKDKSKVALFCIHVSTKTNTGRNSYWFNYTLDQIITDKNWNNLSALISSDERSMFPEVYKSRELCVSEKNAILKMKDIEFISMENALSEAMQEDCPSRSIVVGHSHYFLCFMKTCMRKSLHFMSCYMQDHILVPEYTRSVDDKKVQLKRIHKISRMELIKSLSEGNINPLNGGLPFPQSIYDDLMNKLSKEVMMFRSFKESMSCG